MRTRPAYFPSTMLSAALLSAMTTLACPSIALAAEESPSWAYPVNPPDFKPSPDDGSIRHVPDSTAGYTLAQARDLFSAPDWHSEDHPKMPTIVATGRKPDVFACGVCHRAEGTGGPENASLAGLPAAYIIQQMADYKSGVRSTAVPSRAPQALMIKLAKAVTDDEVREAAAYFSALKPRANIKVVESDSVANTNVYGWFLVKADPVAEEPLGKRIIELPDDLFRFESRDSRATFTAYVPRGSVAKGQTLVADSSKGPACTSCHGNDLRGVAAIPSIAGRSPSYIFRQLHEFKTGARAGPGAQSMKDSMAAFTQEDMIAISAYLGTLKP